MRCIALVGSLATLLAAFTLALTQTKKPLGGGDIMKPLLKVMERSYAGLSSAIESKSEEQFKGLVTPSAKFQSADGQKRDPSQYWRYLQASTKGVEGLKLSFTVKAGQWKNPMATIKVVAKMQGTLANGGKKKQWVRTVERDDLWRFTAGKWLLTGSVETKVIQKP